MNITAERIDAYITKYPTRFEKGSSMSAKQFRRMTNFIVPGIKLALPDSPQNTLMFVNAQAKLNRVLRKKGLKLKSRNYYKEWYIEPDTLNEVTRMRAISQRMGNAATDLFAGHKIHSGSSSADITSDYAEINSYINSSIL